MGEWNIYDSSSQVKATVKKLEYNGEFMGERSITATIYSPSPINLSVGDYLTYRNEVFSIDYDPSILKQARNNTYGQGYVYDSVKFNSRQMELVYCKFLDYVIADNQVHYSSLPNFSFYCETITNLTERIQANLNRLYTGGKAWTITVNTQNVHVGRINIDVQGMTCWDALGLIASKFESTFVIRGRNIVVAPSTDILTGLFQYGKGNGLRSIARTSDPSQGVVTRLRAMGNTTNMPYNYYRNKDMYVYAPITEVSGPHELTNGADIHTTYDFNNCFTVKYPSTASDVLYRTKVSLDKTNWAPAIFSANPAWVGYSVASVMQLPGYDPTQYAAFMQQLNTGTYTKLYFESGISKDKWPSAYKEYTGTLGVTTGEDRLMLPTYPDTTIDPYIDSANISKYGIREESVIFDGSNGLDDIFPTIQGMTAEQARAAGATISLDSGDNGHLDEIVSATQIDDDGIPPVEGEESEMVETFSITLKDIGFNINDYFSTDNAVISMRDGKCEGREFEITECVKSGNKYVLTCKRELDESLNRYFPYDDYNLTAGDKFVLLQIEMPELYIDAAAQRLEDAAEAYLATIDHSIYTIEPKIDNIKAKRHDDEVDSSGEGVKVYDTIYEGMLMQIEDEDLDIDDAIFIDRLTIKEGDSLIPQYEVVLRNEKVKSSIQQIQQQITDIKTGAVSVNGVGAVDASQVNQLIKNYGDNRFLRKDIIDKLKQGVQVGDRFVSGLLGEGGVFRRNADGTTYIEADSLYIRMKAYFDTLEVRKLQYSSGNRVASAAGIKAIKVEKVGMYNNNPVVLDDDGYYHYTDGQGEEQSVQLTVTAYRCYFRMEDSDGNPIDNDFVAGDLARSQEFNLQSGLRGYWRKVVRTNGQTPNEDGLGWIDLSDVSGEYWVGSGVPQAQDDIVQLGNVSDTGRQGAIIEYSTGGGNVPSYQIYQGINSFSLENKNKIDLGYNPSAQGGGRAYMNVYGDFFFGNNAQSDGQYTGSYIKYNSSNGELEIKGKITATSTIGNQSIDQYIDGRISQAGNWTQQEIEALIHGVTDPIQEQIDGEIDTWFYEGTPTLSNSPASNWNTADLKERHVGDLYYDIGTGATGGFAYRFIRSGNEGSYVYSWQYIDDTAITEALARASAAQDTADHKRRVFVNTPTPPYDEGDLWSQGSNGDLMICINPKTASQSYSADDWDKSSKYTDDSALTTFLNGEYLAYKRQVKTQIDQKAETWYQSTDPSDNWDADTKLEHIGDIWHNTSNTTINGVEAGQDAIWSGSAWQPSAVPQEVYDKIDGKADIFVIRPTTYNKYDMWIIELANNSSYMPSGCKQGDIVIATGTTDNPMPDAGRINNYQKTDWVKKDRYTDDSALTTFLSGYSGTAQQLQEQIDQKAETWYQNSNPATLWTNDTLKAQHVGDLWYCTADIANTDYKAGTTWYYKDNGSGTSQRYTWEQQDIPEAVFNKIDGKSSIFVNAVSSPPTNYKKGDLWILPAAATINSVLYKQGDVLTSSTTSATYSAQHWSKTIRYTDDTTVNNIISNYGNILGITSPTAANVGQALGYLREVLSGNTTTDGGLILSHMIALKNGTQIMSGMNGTLNSSLADPLKTPAAWYGGAMVDYETLTSSQQSNWNSSKFARSLFRFDGSGYLASGNITWNAQGAVTIKNITTLSDSQNSNLLNELATFNSAFTFATSGQGSTTALSITPNVPFTSLSVLVGGTAKQVMTRDADGAAKRIPYYSSTTTTTSIAGLQALNENNALEKNRYGLYITGTTYGNTAADLISGEAGVLSFGDGGPQIVMGSGSQHIALLATDHDSAGAGASLHLVSNQSRVSFVTSEIVAKTRLSIGVNTTNTTYPLYVNGNAFVSRLYLASNVYLEYDSTNLGVHLVGAGFYSDSYISALGQSSGSGGGGGTVTTLGSLSDVNTTGAQNGYSLVYNNGTWSPALVSGGSGADMSAINAALSNYLPLSGGTMTGSIIFGATSKGISAKDGGGRTYIALRDNGSNLWIGAGASQSVHHTGAAVISAGWGTYQTTANTTIKIAVPKMSGSTETSTNYDVLHVGNTTSLLIGLLGNGTGDFTDGTEIFSSYAADTGFATENYTDKIYKRSALKMWNYIKGKIGTDTTLTVAKANQLATARTLWGQSFNGTANVSGNMTSVGSITATGNIVTSASDTTTKIVQVSNSNGAVDIRTTTNRGLYDATNSRWIIATNGTYVWASPNTNFGVGTDSPSYKLDVNGTLRATGAATLSSTLSIGGTTTSQSIIPSTTNTYSLGSDSAYWADLYTNIAHFYSEGSSTDDGYTYIYFSNKDTTTNSTSYARIRLYHAHLSSNSGLFFLHGSGDMLMGGGEGVLALANIIRTTDSENTHIAADSIIFFDANCGANNNAATARKGFGVNTSGYIVPFSIDDTTGQNVWANNVGKIGTTSYRWAELNATIANLSTSVTIGSCVISWDSTNNMLHFSTGIYSDGSVSALGASSGSGTVATTLAQLTDTNVSNPSSGQVLTWNGSKWVNSNVSSSIDQSTLNAALSNYVTLSTAQTISGAKTFGNSIFMASGTGIQSYNNKGLLIYQPSSGWTGISSTQWGVGTADCQGVIRSSNADLVHYKGSTNYDILDTSNVVSKLIGLLGNATGDFTDGTQLFSSYANDDGFTGHPNNLYGRPASKMWNYIKSKLTADTALTVAKANQLTTSRTLWGQSFNGTANVSGNMTGVGSISATGDITVTKSNAKISVSGTNGEVGLNSDNNRGVWDYTGSKWLIATNGTNSWLNFGNVGIGTTSPTTKLDVNGAVKATNFSADGSGVAPFYSSTTTLCTNVNADLLDGWHKDNILPLGYIYSSTASLSSYWCKVWSLDMSELQNSDRDATFLVQHGNRGQRGIIHVNVRQTSTAGGGSYTFPSSSNYVSLVSGNIPLDKVRLYQNTSTGICELWLDGNARYGGYSVTMLKKSQLNTKELTSLGTMYSTTFTTAQTLPSGTSVSYITMSASEQVVGAITANDNITVNKQNGKVSVVGNNGEIGLNSATNRGVWDYTSDAWLIGTNGTNTFLSRGNVGIGTTSPSYKLHVSGSIYATDDVTALSDIRHKNVVSEVNAMVEDISKLPVFYFKWKNCRGDDNLHIGTSAQAVQKLFPELVLGGEELSVNYGVLGTTLGILNSRKLMNHEERIKILEEENERLRTEINELKGVA